MGIDLEVLADQYGEALAHWYPPPKRVERAFADLAACYAEPHRRYHTLAHVAGVVGHVADLADEADDRHAVALAAWYHDIVYDPLRHDNEERSAHRARAVLPYLGVDEATVGCVVHLVGVTVEHRATNPDEAVICDADLASLGSAPEIYEANTVAIRAEYAHVSDADWRVGRGAVIDAFLARDRIFVTDRMRAAREAQARANLTAEHSQL